MKTRIQVLLERRELLIKLNLQNGYSQSGNPKIDKYYRCLLYIRKKINEEDYKHIVNRKTKSKILLINPQEGLTFKKLRILTNPTL